MCKTRSVPPRATMLAACLTALVLTACSDSSLAGSNEQFTPDAMSRPDTPDAAPPTASPAPAEGKPDLTTDAGFDAAAERDALALPDALDCPLETLGHALIHVGELRLHVACRGAGKTLLLLHGYPGSHLTWLRLVEPLVRSGYRVVAPDLRGYNLSDKPLDVAAYEVDRLLADLEGLVAATGESRLMIVGHDWGGLLAYVYAQRHPTRVRGLVTMGAPHPDIWGHPEIDPIQARAAAAYVPLLVSPAGELAFARYPMLLASYLSEQELALYKAAWEQPGAKLAMNSWYAANLHPLVKLPSNVTVGAPTLALWGAKDTFATPSQLEHLPRYVSDLEVVLYPEGDHFLPLQMPEALAQTIAGFERQLAP